LIAASVTLQHCEKPPNNVSTAMDTIRLSNMTFYGFHGASAAERKTGRRFEVDAEIKTDIREAAKTDKLESAIDYTKVYSLVEEIILENRFVLLETIAEKLAREILENFQVQEVTIRVRKRIPPIPGNLDYIEVEVNRTAS
jgi:dihydroneopterin aldolase